MDVTVIFATYNREDILEKVFDAWKKVDQCTRYTYEILCSDDESSDHTTTIIEKAANELPIKLIRNKKGGAGKARNAALRIASGKLIIFTGDDIFPNPDFINAHYENYLRFGESVATLGRIEWHKELKVNHLMRHITNIGCEQFGFIALPVYRYTDFRHFYTSNISVSKKLLDSLDQAFHAGFDKYGFEDIELGYRLQKNGMKIYYDPDIVTYHHHIYDQVNKFCVRQRSAGEELVVFHHMHQDLEDKCIFDVENCADSYQRYLKKQKGNRSIIGYMELSLIHLMKKYSRHLEKRIEKNNRNWQRNLCSIVYGGIFRFYLYYGTVMRIAEENNYCSNHSQLARFTCQYLRKPYHQIYWDTGFGMNEGESRKWICWDSDPHRLEKKIEKGTQQLRVSPLKNECIARIHELYFETEQGEKVNVPIVWHNACKCDGIEYVFTNTNDPQIILSDIKEDYKNMVVDMSVKNRKKKSLYSIVRHAAAKIFHRVRVENQEKKEWQITYDSGQPRRIQIGIGGISGLERKKLIEKYQEQIKILGSDVLVSDLDQMQRDYSNYLYQPKEEPLDAIPFFQVVYTLFNHIYDYILVSKAYTDFPEIAAKTLDDVLIYSDMLVGEKENGWNPAARGRWMRLPSETVEESRFYLNSFMQNIWLKKEFLLCSRNTAFTPVFRISVRTFLFQKEKPLIFVVPIFLAVGGVERNTIETMRALKEQYEFCLITMERHTKEQGSLHYQLKGICKYVFDLREITEFENYLQILYELNEIFHPELLWLCNNSPWFEMHTMQIRKIFSNTAIVAQDVYDTKVGWIEYYKNDGPKTFDRYIAITESIRETLENKYKIPKEKMDVIYSLVDAKQIRNVQKEEKSYLDLCKKYGLDARKKHFSYVGRLTEQKNPLRYLSLVHAVMQKKREEFEFIMVGDGVLRSKVENFIIEHHMEEEVIQIPYLSNTPEFIGLLDGLILTSDYEGLPIVSIEAMSMATPILSTDVGDIKKFILQYQVGRIFEETQSDYENFQFFYKQLDEFAKNGKKYANELLEFFSASNISKLYDKTFKRAMEECRKEEQCG